MEQKKIYVQAAVKGEPVPRPWPNTKPYIRYGVPTLVPDNPEYRRWIKRNEKNGSLLVANKKTSKSGIIPADKEKSGIIPVKKGR